MLALKQALLCLIKIVFNINLIPTCLDRGGQNFGFGYSP